MINDENDGMIRMMEEDKKFIVLIVISFASLNVV